MYLMWKSENFTQIHLQAGASYQAPQYRLIANMETVSRLINSYYIKETVQAFQEGSVRHFWVVTILPAVANTPGANI